MVTAQNNCVRIVDEHHIKLPKLGKVRCSISRQYEGNIVSATILRSPTFQYYVTLICNNVPEEPVANDVDSVTGIDVGIKETMVCSNGTRYANEKIYYKYEKKLEIEAKKLSRKKRGSKNYEKQRKRLAKVHEKIANIRRDSIHKMTTAVVRDSQAIAVESLDVTGMASKHNFGKAVNDVAIGMALRLIEYKCKLNGRKFVKVDKWFPSSKLCSVCGHKYNGLTLNMRHWRCPECGSKLDRDFNAACNLSAEGYRLLTQQGAVGHTDSCSSKTPAQA